MNGEMVGTASTDFATNGFNIVGGWKTFKFPWIAPSNLSSVGLEIRLTTPNATSPQFPDSRGYDFGLDNISFGGISQQTVSLPIGPFTNCASISATQSVCVGDEKTLTATVDGGMVFSRWEDEDGVLVGTTQEVRVNREKPTKFYAIGNTALGNVLDNGDFSAGNVGFKNGGIYYTYNSSIAGGGNNVYTITDKTSAGNGSAWYDLNPRPGSTDNQMFVTDSKGKDPVIAWEFSATAGQDFQFEGWFANQHKFLDQVNNTPAHMAISIIPKVSTPNASDAKIIDFASGRDTSWHQLKGIWTAPSTGDFTFYVRSLNTSDRGGNDFVLDDFTLYPLVANSEKKFEILVENCACDPVDTVLATYCGTDGTFEVIDKYPLLEDLTIGT